MQFADQSLRKIIPFLSEELLREIRAVAQLKIFDADSLLIEDGTYIKLIPIVLSGRIKVYRESELRELLLYYIQEGESCFMSVSACIMNEKSKVEAITETKTTVILIPTTYVNQWLKKYPEWVNYIMRLSTQRFDELLDTVDAISFSKLDERLMKFLLAEAKNAKDGTVKMTHQQIAHELGTAREVISRLLKKLEQNHKIELKRSCIKVKEI